MPNLLRTVPYCDKNFFFAHGCSLYKASSFVLKVSNFAMFGNFGVSGYFLIASSA